MFFKCFLAGVSVCVVVLDALARLYYVTLITALHALLVVLKNKPFVIYAVNSISTILYIKPLLILSCCSHSVTAI